MLPATDFCAACREVGITHVVLIPDSHLGRWVSAFDEPTAPLLIRPTREGEAIALAAGLLLGGANPLVVMQSTGFFEAGDAFRNAVHDLGLPLRLLVGVRSDQAIRAGRSADSAGRFAEPIVAAWSVPFLWVTAERQTGEALRTILNERRGPLVILWSE